MKVTLKNGGTLETNDSFGARLIEQGKAVLAPAETAENKEPEEKAQVSRKGGRKNGTA